ncbi:TniQ family protein [Rhizobium sp. BE258]|uniref:TniQ family protein n=1 Tax=Rhizobium sp. BE258 TaxID=2817722 RepID=UPI002863A929|nr:TniQ family protein [Rhizobium sp. BE258]MDR7141947.1 hypothetical protein [Rhizobium sp. BE258]
MYRVPLFDDETLTSYCSRLAAANGKGPAEFCLDMGFSFMDVSYGRDSAIKRLATLGQIESERLHAATVPVVEGNCVVGVETLSPFTYTRTRLRVCTACLKEDAASADRRPRTRQYVRRNWALRFLRTCPTHLCSIVDLGSTSMRNEKRHDLIDGLGQFQLELREATRSQTGREMTAFEFYALDRINGLRNHGEILDGMSLDRGGTLCEHVGVTALFGRRAEAAELTDEQQWAAAQSGFEFLSRGIPGLYSFLDMMHSSLPHLRPGSGGRHLYGRFYECLSRREQPEWADVRKLIRNYAFSVLPLDDTSEVFGTSTGARYIAEAAIRKRYNMNPKHLRRMAVALGLHPLEAQDSGPVEKTVADKVADILNDALLPTQAAKVIGTTHPKFNIFVKEGFFQPIIQSGHGIAVSPRYSRRALETFIDAIKPVDPYLGSAELMSLFAVSRKLTCKITELMALLRDGKLHKVGWDAGHTGLDAVRIDPLEVSAILTETLTDDLLTIKETASFCQTSWTVAAYLISEGHLPKIVARNPRKRASQTYVRREDAKAFCDKYVSFINAMKEYGVGKDLLRAALTTADMSPSIPVDLIGVKFFNRAELRVAIDRTRPTFVPTKATEYNRAYQAKRRDKLGLPTSG